MPSASLADLRIKVMGKVSLFSNLIFFFSVDFLVHYPTCCQYLPEKHFLVVLQQHTVAKIAFSLFYVGVDWIAYLKDTTIADSS